MLEKVAVDVAVVAGLGVGAYIFRALDVKGTVAAALLGLLVMELGGFYPFLALLTFVILGVLATRYRFHEKSLLGAAQSRGGGIRSWGGNVLGNGLAALIFLTFEYFSRQDVFWAASFAAIATVNGDTLASELGKVFGKNPKLITTLKPSNQALTGGRSPGRGGSSSPSLDR